MWDRFSNLSFDRLESQSHIHLGWILSATGIAVSDKSVPEPGNATPGDSGDIFRYLFASAGVAMIATDRELKIKSWNQAATRIFGASASQMMGTETAAIIPQRRRQVAKRVLRRAIEHAESNEFEFQHRDEKGLFRELAVTVTPISDDAGGRHGALICVRDITRRVEAVAEMLDSQKMASLGEMAGEVAHHFTNILGGVVTSVDYALAGDEDAVCRRVLEQTARALGRATHLVRGLLAFAEGDRQHQDQSDLTELVLEVAHGLEQRSREQGVTFTLDTPTLPVLAVARNPVTTVLQNLTQNALDAMPDGGELTLEVRHDENRVLIQIRDTGRGLDPDELKRVFEPFYRAKSTRSSSVPTKARGLGLAVAFGIMQSLGGSIAARSERDKGSCFEVSIPTS